MVISFVAELVGHLARGWLSFLGGFTGLLLACWALRGRSAHQGASNSR
jgi:hypothetical protein